METTNFEIRSVDTEARTIEGIAAPYGETIDAGDYYERFEPGAFGDPQDVRLYSEHDHLDKRAPIGVVTKGEDTEDGYKITARISATDKGNEVYELVKDGVLKNFSVGFTPVEDRIEDDNTIVRTKVDLKEVSVVAFPAYTSAQILAVRAAAKDSTVRDDSENTNNERGHIEKNMTNTEIEFASVADLNDVRDAVDEMNRRLAVASDDTKDAAPQFRSAGAFIKAVADKNDPRHADADRVYRAYTGATTADSHISNGWLDQALKVIDKGRPLVDAFTRAALPASGTVVTYPYVSGTTGDVASQANEGDDLTYLEVAISTATAPVLTYGGYSELTRQAIERSDVSYLDAVLRRQAASYAKTTNAKVRTALTGASAQSGSSFTLSSATAGDFIKAVVNGRRLIDANGEGAAAEFVIVSGDVAEAAASVLDTNGGQIFTGGIAGLPIKVDDGLSAKSFYVASSDAITTWENSAPIRLDDENVVNLSKVFSIYGYMAVGVTNANGLVKATVA
jgi:HK97 family phage prohead protease